MCLKIYRALSSQDQRFQKLEKTKDDSQKKKKDNQQQQKKKKNEKMDDLFSNLAFSLSHAEDYNSELGISNF